MTTRRDFLKAGVAGAALAGVGFGAPALQGGKRPNLLFIITDQQGNDAISAHGCRDLHTPRTSTAWCAKASRSASPTPHIRSVRPRAAACSPAACLPRPVSSTTASPSARTSPTWGQWLGQEGYEAVYSGKWHVPAGFTNDIPGFTVLPGGMTGQGNMGDAGVSRAVQGYLLNRSHSKPFALVTTFLQPHDICGWWPTTWALPDGKISPRTSESFRRCRPIINTIRASPRSSPSAPGPDGRKHSGDSICGATTATWRWWTPR